MKHLSLLHYCLTGALAAGLSQPLLAAPSAQPASAITAAKNADVLKALPFSDRDDYESVTRGLIAPFQGQIKNAAGSVVWDTQPYGFLSADKAPDTVNPSLWRLAQLNNHAGLFQVPPRRAGHPAASEWTARSWCPGP